MVFQATTVTQTISIPKIFNQNETSIFTRFYSVAYFLVAPDMLTIIILRRETTYKCYQNAHVCEYIKSWFLHCVSNALLYWTHDTHCDCEIRNAKLHCRISTIELGLLSDFYLFIWIVNPLPLVSVYTNRKSIRYRFCTDQNKNIRFGILTLNLGREQSWTHP